MEEKQVEENRVAEDSTKLFMSLLLSNQKSLYVYILSLVLYPSDAEDILQDTLAEMWKQFNTFQPGTSFVAWGKTIAKFKILNYRKKNKLSKLMFDEDVAELIQCEADYYGNLNERIEAMKTCSKGLSQREMQYLHMRYNLGLSFKKIASDHGISKQRVYTIISLIHSKLARCIRHKLNMDGLT